MLAVVALPGDVALLTCCLRAKLWEGWKKIAAMPIGNVKARILLTIFVRSVILPFGLAVRSSPIDALEEAA